MKLWKSAEAVRDFLLKVIHKYKPRLLFTNDKDLMVLIPNMPLIDASKRFLEKDIEIVIVKMGIQGVIAVTRKGIYKEKAVQVPIIEDVIGAGDALNAAFLAAYYRGYSIEYCLKLGSVAAALVVTVRGDIEALPTWSDLELFLRSLEHREFLR